MIVSHALRMIFVRTRKTASSSLEIALSAHCGPDDIMLPLAEDGLRRELGVRGPQNHEPFGESGRGHMPARRVRRLVGDETWDRYLTVAVERNPWDKVVSWYFWRTKNSAPRPSFDDFVTERVRSWPGKMDVYCDRRGEVIVDRVMRYENLDEEVASLARLLGLPEVPRLPRAKSGIRPGGLHYRDMYSPGLRDLVGEVYAREIEMFGYSF